MRPIDADKLKAKIRTAEEYDTRCSVLISDVKKIFHTQIDEAPTLTYEDLAPQWISVKERLPEKSGYYLVTTYNGNRECLPYSSKNRAFNSFDGHTDHDLDIQCTHWMPLPEPPKE